MKIDQIIQILILKLISYSDTTIYYTRINLNKLKEKNINKIYYQSQNLFLKGKFY